MQRVDEAARTQTTGVVLCGGRGQRLRGIDKPLASYRGEPLVAQVANRLAPQVRAVLISANRNAHAYERYGAVIADTLPGYPGPLGGISAALAVVETPLLFVCPGDGPDLPGDAVAKLFAGLGAADAAVAHDGQRRQPLYLLLRGRCRHSLDRYLAAGRRSVQGWLEELDPVEVRFTDSGGFRNLNTPEDFR